MEIMRKTKETLSYFFPFLVLIIGAGALIEVLHWAFFEPKPVAAWVGVVVVTALFAMWVRWQHVLDEREIEEERRKYEVWFDA